MANKNILLIEPAYKNKYPPLGLMKIAQYHGPSGKRDRVRFIKGEDRSVLSEAWDRVYVTTLFSFEFTRIAQSIDFAKTVVNGQTDKIFVGGIAASLMHDAICARSPLARNSIYKGPPVRTSFCIPTVRRFFGGVVCR